MARTVLARAADAQPIESRTPGRKQVTIVQPEVSARRVDKFTHMNAVRDSRALDGSDKLILYTLVSHAKQAGHDVRPGLSLLAEETGISVATLKRRVPDLIRKGYLLQLTSGKGGNSKHASLYHLSLPVDVAIEVTANGSPDELLDSGSNGSPDELLDSGSNGSSGSFNSSSGSFNSSPDELTTSKENIPKNIPGKAGDESPTSKIKSKTGPMAQTEDSGHGGALSADKILATITGKVPPRVRPLAGHRIWPSIDTWERDYMLPVWHHQGFDLVYLNHKHAHYPGPEWKRAFMADDDWAVIKDRDTIQLLDPR